MRIDNTPRRSHAQVVLRQKPKKKNNRMLKGVLVVLFASALTTLAINASDTFSTPGSSLMAGVGKTGDDAPCPSDMVYVSQSSGGYCIDRYENSAGVDCAHADPQNQFETGENLARAKCVSASVKNTRPWTNVSVIEAMQLCARAGKHLPDNSEWFRASFGTPDTTTEGFDSACVTGRIGESHAAPTGSAVKCLSTSGASDMVGNVWEWVDATVYVGMLDNHALPDEGFIGGVDTSGVPTETGTSSDRSFGGDYFFIDKSGTKGMFRGGFWSMHEKAGIYTVNATIPTSFVGSAVGFRCAK